MAERRHHGDVLIAGCMILGMIGWAGATLDSSFDLTHLGKGVVFFVAAFAAAFTARRVVPDLDRGEVGIATLVTLAILFGIKYERDGRELDLDILAPILVAELGALAGAFAQRRRETRASQPLLIVAAGAGAFGASMLAIGLAMLSRQTALVGLALLLAAPLGGYITARLVPHMVWWHGALGQAAALGTLFFSTNRPQPITGLLIGAVLGFLIGGVGALFGSRVREKQARSRKPDLPEVRQVS